MSVFGGDSVRYKHGPKCFRPAEGVPVVSAEVAGYVQENGGPQCHLVLISFFDVVWNA